jgi:hypothetical protein
VNEPLIQKISSGIAAGAAISPWWLPALKAASEVAGMLLPVLGVVWLIVQMIAFFRGRK